MNRRQIILGVLLVGGAFLCIHHFRQLESARHAVVSASGPVGSKSAVRPPHSGQGDGRCQGCQDGDHGNHGNLACAVPHHPGPDHPRQSAISAGFLDRIVTGSKVAFALPDGRDLVCDAARIERDAKGVVRISGKFTTPESGSFFFQRQDFPGVAGELVGHVLFEKSDIAWKVLPEGAGGAPVLMEVSADAVVCMNLPLPQAMPQDHPDSSTVPNPPYQSVIPLQSLPGATGVIYLDFDGEKGPFPGWYDRDVAHSGFDNNMIRDVWIRVAEDFLPFNLNVTTDVKIWQAAPQAQRIRCIITPSNFYGAGGVAYVGSFNWGGEPTCWAMNYTSDGGAQVISHEVGHTLGLYHHGHNGSEYYWGQGSGITSWAPIMGAGYGKNIKQWSKGDYYLATNTWQDDLAVISSQNNGVSYRADDIGDTLATSAYLNVAGGGVVTNQQGIIGTTGEVDAFRFKTVGGAVNLSITTATSYSPNLDLYAELVNASSGLQVAATDANSPELNQNLSATLPAGEYLLKIKGVGYPTPADNTGYSDYGSLGSYRIDGTVSGGESLQAFSIAENSANGTSVGTVLPVALTGNLTYTISSGNAGGAFAIDPSSGVLTVASSSALDYETLSTRFDDPASIELFVTIANASGGTEIVRALVTVANVNEAPSLAGAGDVTMIENSRAGTVVGQLTASDVDRYDYPVFSIPSGNESGFFAIDPATGLITVAAPPVVGANTTYSLVIRATDAGGLFNSATINVTVLNLPSGFASSPGGLYRTFFHNIGGTTVADLTSSAAFPNSPDREIFLTSFDGGGYGDNFGSTIRGYLIPPTSGAYTFYTASDDMSQLILGSDSSQVSAPVIASMGTWSNQYEWDVVPGSTSAAYNLVAGQPYYIEMRHKEGGGGDHAAVAWSGPGISRQVIPGRYLAPFHQNYAPRPTGSLSVSEVASAGTLLGRLSVTEVNIGDSLSNYAITAGNEAGLFAINASTGDVTLAQAGQFNPATTPYYDITFSVTDNGTPALTGSGVVRINVIPYSLYFDPNGADAGSVANGGNYSWVGNYWVGGQGGVSTTSGWVSGAKANFAATAPASPLAYNVSIAGYNSGIHGGISSIDVLNGTVSFTGNVDNFYLVNPMTVRAATGAAIRFDQTCGTPGLGFNLNSQTATFEGDVAFASCGIGNAGSIVVNSGTLSLNSASQYTGATTINGGTLALAGSGQIYSTLNWGNAAVTVNAGGILQADRWEEGNGSLGQLGYGQANLVLNGGTLRYTGNTNPNTEGRGFTVGATGATLESSAPAGQVWNIHADSRSATYGISSNGGGLTLSGSGNGWISKAISGSGALVKNGSGTWTLNATNTYSGGTTVSGGTLVLSSPASLPGAVTVSADTGSGTGGGTLSMQQSGIVTWSQNVAGGGRWKVATGSGSQTVSLTGTYTGFTGVLEVASGSGKINLASSANYPPATATLQLDANTSAYITGGGTFRPQIRLYGGSIGEPTFGQLRFATANPTLSGTVTLLGNTSIAVDSGRSATISGVISESGGSFGFTKNQPGTLTLSGNNTYSGGTTFASGVLRTGTSSGSFGIGNLTVASGLTASIRHTAGNSLGRQAYVYLNGTTGKLSIAAGATETVARLYLNGVRQPSGTYRSTSQITTGGTLIVGEIAPNAPTSLAATSSSPVAIRLAWTHASVNETAIKVERSLSSDSGFAEIASLAGTARSFEDTGLSANTTYYYRVLAANAAGNSPYSLVASTITQLPPAPTGLVATAGPGQVSLAWNASSGASGYVVRRSINPGGPYTDIASPSASSHLDPGLIDTTYYYVVAAVAPNGGIGNPSAEVSATPTLADSDGAWNLASGGDWMTNGNWRDSIIGIGAGRSASFPLAAGGTINQNRSGLAIGALSFSNGNYTITGNSLNLDVTSGSPTVSVGSGVTATIATSLSGSEGMVKSGAGTLALTAYNHYTGGTTVNAGTLEVAGASGGWGLLRGSVTVNPGATLAITGGDVTGFGWNDPVTNLTLNGGTASASGGSHIGFGAYTTVALNDGGTISGNWQWNGDGSLGFSSSGDSTNTISGALVLRTDAGANHSFNVANGAADIDLQVSASLSDQYPEVWWSPGSHLVKSGTGTMVLSGSNSHDGITDIVSGTLVVTSNNALGTGGHSGNTMTFIRDGATLAFSGGVSINEHFHVWGTGVGGLGALRNLSGNNALTDSYCLRSNTTIGVDAGSLTIPDFYESEGSFSLTKTGSGELILTGGSSYTGNTSVLGGTLRIAGSLGSGSVTVSNATLAGNGTIGGAVSLGTGGNLATRIADWTGSAGSGFEDLAVQSLTLQPGTPHVVTVDTTGLANFTEISKTFPILLTTGGISGFSATDFTVSAPGFAGTGTWSVQQNGNQLALVYQQTAPIAPTSLTANSTSPVAIQLAWTHAAANDTAIKVERSLAAGGGFTEIASLSGSARSFEDAGLSANTTYYYRVLAVNAAGNSPYSEVASASTPLPSAPVGLSATAGVGQVSLSWTASTGAGTYVVRRAATSGGPYTDVATTAGTSYIDEGLLDLACYYVVAATAPNGGISAPSAEASATPSIAQTDGVWNVSSGGDWMTPGNWQNSTIALGAGYAASFPLAAGGTIHQNRTGLVLGALSFANGNYTITDSGITLDVSSGSPTVSVGSGVTATIATSLSGSEGMVKSGAGTLALTAYNHYTGGTTVNAGTLEVAGASGGWGWLRGSVTVNPGATLAITGGDGTGFGWNDPVDNLTIRGGTVNASGSSHIGFGAYTTVALNDGGTISGNWQWNGDGSLGFSSSGDSTNTISGALVLRTDAGANHSFNVANGAADIDLQVSASLSDQYPEVWWSPGSHLVKSGTGTMVLSGSNSHDGITDIVSGTLVVTSNNALGTGGHSGNTMTFIRDGATLAFSGGVSVNEHFHVWGSGVGGLGALRNLNGDNALTDSYCLRSNTTIGVDAGSLTIPLFYESGGAFSLTKIGDGTLTLTGGNSYTGGTTVSGGILELKNTAWILGNVNGSGVTVGNNAILRANNSLANQLNGLTLNGGTVEAINSTGNGDWGDFFLTGNVTATGSAALHADIALRANIVNFDVATGGSLNIGGVLHNGANFGIYNGSPAIVTKSGSGTMIMTGSQTYTGNTSVLGGTLRIAGSLGSGSVTVSNATLVGNGTIGGAVSLGTGGNLATRIADWTGSAGSGFEDLAVQSLTLQPGTPHVVTVDTTGLANFTEISKTFPILLTTGGISGFSATDFTVSAPGFAGTGTWSVQQNGNQLALVYAPLVTPAYDTWAATMGLTAENDGGNMDPDQDGFNNLQEFAFDRNPLNSGSEGKSTVSFADPDGDGPESPTLILTIPVRDGATFHGPGDLVSDPVDGVIYQIQGSTNLSDFTSAEISEVAPVPTSGLPLLSPGWSYRSFRFSGVAPSSGFLRTVVSEAAPE